MLFTFSRWPRHAFRGLCLLALLLVPATIVRVRAAATTAHGTRGLEARRAAFIKAYGLAQQGDPGWKQAASSLANYPLYPYLPAAALEHDLGTATLAQVQAYLARWPDLIPAHDLRRKFLHELAHRMDWSGFRSLYRPGLGDALHCNALQAKLASGTSLDFDHDLSTLWQEASLPSDCDPILAWAHDHGLLTRTRLWQRIDRAADAGRGGTVASLAQWLHGLDAIRAQRLALALREPARAVHAALQWPDTPRSRAAAAIAMRNLAREDSADADRAWSKLRHHLHFNHRQYNHIVHDLALFRATNFTPNALARLRNLPSDAQSADTRGWRLRVALSRRDWHGVLAAWSAMPPAQQQDPQWRYFRARALARLGRTARAHAIYADIARDTSYYGFLAADRVRRPYSICPEHLADDPAREQALLQRPGLERAFELFAVNLPDLARREWARALNGADADTFRLAGMLAWKRGWYNRAIGVFSYGEGLHLYTQRFPLVPQDGVTAQAHAAGVDPAWAYAIIRAESAWRTDAHSGADAYGLMQLLPRTAARVARALHLPYHGPDSLYDPRINVALGTHYLAQMAARYSGAPWLASAAYNAGPAQVDTWLGARGDLPPDLFVATIPYHETREYVARVLTYSVVYDWRLHQRAVPISQRMPRFGSPYSPPDAHTPRKAVACAMPPATPAASPAADSQPTSTP